MAANPRNTEIDLATFDFDAIPTDESDRTSVVERPVPPNIVALAQYAVDNGKKVTKTFRGQSQAFVTAFAETMKWAGDHTTPKVTIKVLHEPDSIIVVYYPTKRRGPGGNKQTGQTEANDAENGQSDPE